MKKFTLSLLAVSSALVLTACGGSSSDDVKNNVAGLVQPVANTGNNPANAPNDGNQDYLSGQYWQAHHKQGGATNYTLNNATLNEDNISQLVVGDKTFDLSDVFELTYLGNEGTGIHMGGTEHSRFGVAWRDLPNQEDEDIVFYRGIQTLPKDMPTSGKMNYVGQAVHSCASACSDMTAKSSFEVDFGAKTVKGIIDHADQKVNLGATISGSSFAGVANGVQTNGAFYGAKAEELSGIYKDTNGQFFGAFGATQTK